MKKLVSDINITYLSLGNIFYGPTEAEIPSLKFRRSLYVVKDIKKGEVFTSENIRSIRPCYGINPKHLWDILGGKAERDYYFGEPFLN
jgi:N-acetylneuraminate synthase